MWTVTADTTFHFSGRVLVHEWSALLSVALDASFGLRLYKTRTIQCSVRTMTIGAFHQPLRNAVMHRLRKLCADRRVTGVAQFRLRGFQETASEPTRFVRPLRYLEKLRLRGRSRSLAGIFYGIHEVTRMTIVA